MRIYEIHSTEGYELCHPKDENDFEQIHLLINGTERARSWHPITVEMINEDEGQPLMESDSPWLGWHALIFRSHAIDKLAPVLQSNGELLPLICAGAQVSIYNPTKVLDALDESSSDIRRFKSGRIMLIDRYVFKPNIVRDAQVFKLSSIRVSPTLVQQGFVDLWKAASCVVLSLRKFGMEVELPVRFDLSLSQARSDYSGDELRLR